jgi:hypothetical protein
MTCWLSVRMLILSAIVSNKSDFDYNYILHHLFTVNFAV